MAKPLPPTRPPGTIDLLETSEAHPTDPDWRADALGKSRHSRLADEVRPPGETTQPAEAELVCARITREALGELAPALLLLSGDRRRRAQTLAAWTVTLFDLARRPGLAGLDGDRLAQINAWEFQTDAALDGQPATQPVFVALAGENERAPWPREALDRIVSSARSVGVGRETTGPGVFDAALAALFGPEDPSGRGAAALAPLAFAASTAEPLGSAPSPNPLQLDGVPSGWRRAASYVRHAVRRRGRGRRMGLGARLLLLALAALRPSR